MPFVIRLTAGDGFYYWSGAANAFGTLDKATIYPFPKAAPTQLVIKNRRGGFTVLDREIEGERVFYEDREGEKLIDLVPVPGDSH
jgi:hypothetical protein